jgi:hypothetical protein
LRKARKAFLSVYRRSTGGLNGSTDTPIGITQTLKVLHFRRMVRRRSLREALEEDFSRSRTLLHNPIVQDLAIAFAALAIIWAPRVVAMFEKPQQEK